MSHNDIAVNLLPKALADGVIRVDIGPELHPKSPDAPSTYAWTAAAHGLSGRSRQPLLDACRALQAIGLDLDLRVELFRSGSDEPDISCPLGVGAGLTVLENRNTGPRFIKYVPFTGIAFPVRPSVVGASSAATLSDGPQAEKRMGGEHPPLPDGKGGPWSSVAPGRPAGVTGTAGA